MFSLGQSLAIDSGMIETLAEGGAKAYEKLTDAQNDWSNKTLDNLNKVAEAQAQYMEQQANLYVMFGDSIGRAISEGFGKGAEGWGIAMRGVLIEGMDFIKALALQSIAASTLQDMKVMPWFAALAMGAAKAVAVSTLIGAAQAGVKSFAPKGYASGTRSAPGGWGMTGENGPELQYIPRGSQIYNSHETSNIMKGNTYNVYLPASAGPQTFRQTQAFMEKMQRNGYLDRFSVRIRND